MALEQCLDAGKPLPSLLVTDLYMPVMDGIEIVHRIKSNPAFMSICVAVCSGSSDPADQRMTRDAGADFHLEKPLDIDTALDKYQAHCRALGLI
jgi:CheY-like chemotaxis protein